MRALRWRRLMTISIVVVAAGCAPSPAGCAPPDGDGDPSTTTTTEPGGSTTSTTEPGGSTTTTTEPGGSTTSTTTTEPGGSTTTTTLPPGEATGVRSEELDVEDCFSPVDDGLYVDRVGVTDCDEPHDMEVYAQFELDGESLPGGEGGDYPGGNELTWAAQDECRERFEDYVGIDYFESDFDLTVITPSFSTWDLGDRLATCVLIDPDGDPLTSSAKGAAR
jgi:hypothetical protein